MFDREKWRRPPQYPVELDLGGFFRPSEVTEVIAPSAYGLRRGGKAGLRTLYSLGGTDITLAQGPGGRCASLTGSSITSYIQLASDADTILDDFEGTMLILRSLKSLSFTSAQSYGYVNSNVDRVSIHFPWTDDAVYWDWGNGILGQGRITTGALSWTVGKIEAWAFVAGDTRGREIWRNGIKIASDVPAHWDRPLGSGSAFRVGAASGGGESQPECLYQFVLLGNLALDDARIKAWSENPWQIFRPRSRRAHFNVISAGGGSGNMKLVGSIGFRLVGHGGGLVA